MPKSAIMSVQCTLVLAKKKKKRKKIVKHTGDVTERHLPSFMKSKK